MRMCATTTALVPSADTVVCDPARHKDGQPAQFLQRNLTIGSTTLTPAFLDFNRTAYALLVATDVVLAFDNVVVRGVAPQALG